MEKHRTNLSNLDTHALTKCLSYIRYSKIRDLYDICDIVNHHVDALSPIAKQQLAISFEAKGLEYAEYVIATQPDEKIDKVRLASDVLAAFDRLGLSTAGAAKAGGYTTDAEIFQKVWTMRQLPNWEQIDAFMGKEYLMKWIRFKKQTAES